MQGESNFTEETWASWLEPFQAVRLLIQAGLDDRESAVSWLKGRLRNGDLRAAGWHLQLDPEDPLKIKSEMVVGRYKRSTWDNIAAIPWKDDFWVSGDYMPDDPLEAFRRTIDRDEFTHYLTKARFDPTPIREFCAAATAPVTNLAGTNAQSSKPSGGRPPKPFWDELWASVAAALYNGDLDPKRQADVEKAMLNWAANNGHEIGEATVRRAARLLWHAIQGEDQN
jgi:hypothetical protein